jgi:glycosyltransferase involved in cell wall biosynthesis
VLYVCIPAHNEAPTIGLLLWRLRKVFQDSAREYEILVYDDASTDATVETLQPYAKVLPLTVIRGDTHVGYAAALEALARAVVKKTRYPRRDAMLIMQGDFTDQPEHVAELVKRFEGGADIVVAERAAGDAAPAPVRRLRRLAPWTLRPFMKIDGVRDPCGSFRLYRIAVVRDLVKRAGDARIATHDGWAANVEWLCAAAPLARRIETVEVASRYDLRPRASRVRLLSGALALSKFGWATRSRRSPRQS